jgi:hypothetical protein
LVYGRISAPWSPAVWIQSIHGRRLAASTGPVAPCICPTLLWIATASGWPVTFA